MTLFEIAFPFVEPFLPALYFTVRRRILGILAGLPANPTIVDVGARKSHYTTGLPGSITLTDLPRETSLQEELNLGFNTETVEQLRRRRSNIREILLDDMTNSNLASGAFDCVLAIEVLEHVEDDDAFVRQVERVLKPRGIFFLSTPNGDFVENTNPDHIRHYRRDQLHAVLSRHFPEVEVEYAIRGGRWYRRSLRSWSLRRPLRTAATMASALVNVMESRSRSLRDEPTGTMHLFGTARKGDE